MKADARRGLPVALLSSFIGLATGWLLVSSDSSPDEIVRRVHGIPGDPVGSGSTESVRLLLVAVAWLVVSGLLIRACLGWWAFLRPSLRCLVMLVRSERRPAWMGSTVVVLTGLFASLRTTNDAASPGTPSAVESEHGGADRPVAASNRTNDSTGPLPALASSGLAVGLAGHIRKERESLLATAPNDAKLSAPSAPSVSTGIALFERAASTGDLAPVVHEPARSSDTNRTARLVIPLGVDDDRLVSVSLRAGDMLSIDADTNEAARVLRHLLNTVALAPWLDSPLVVVCGFTDVAAIIDSTVTVADTPDDVRAVVLASLIRRPNGCVVVVASRHDPRLDELAEHGALVITTLAGTRRPVVRVVREPGGWRIPGTGESFRPYGATTTEVGVLRTMTREMLRLEVDGAAHRPEPPTWESLVRVLGPVEIVRRDHSEITFRKSKSVELLCWLAYHRERPTVSGARTALWEVDVRDATFHNVLSELRRGFSAVGLPEVVGRANKQRLFLDERVSTDGDLLRRALIDADRLPPREAAESLCGVLGLVRGLPFASADYAWADAEGITSTLYWMVTRSIDRVVELVGDEGPTQPLLDATAAGLRMAPGDETLTMVRRRIMSGTSVRASGVSS